MQITINGEQREVPAGTTAEALLELLGMQGQRLAMEVNREIVPRSGYASFVLPENGEVEIVRAIGGGSGMPQRPIR